jgi:hypothetical protein
MEDKYGRDSDVFNVRVKGNFPKQNTGGLFDLAKLEKAMNNDYIEGLEEGVKLYGLDVARYGNDSTTRAKRTGLVIHPLEQVRKKNTVEVTGWTNNGYQLDNIDYVVVDTIGLGAGVFDQLATFGVSVIDGNSSYSPDDPIYLNKRAEMYFNLKEAVDKGAKLPRDEELLEELLIITYSYTPQGKIKLVSKEEIKDALGRSPDKSDSCALTFFGKFAPKHRDESYHNDVEGWL